MNRTKKLFRMIFITILLIIPILIYANSGNSSFPETNEFNSRVSALKIPFIANNGQINNEVIFYAQTFGGKVFITNENKIVYSLISNNSKPMTNLSIHEEFVGGFSNGIKGLEQVQTKINYFNGQNQSEWITDIPSFEILDLGCVYNKIEVQLKAYGDNIEKLFYLKPGAKPNDIKIKLTGLKNVFIDEDGELIAETESGKISFTKPVAYQENPSGKTYVDVEYSVNGNIYSFSVGDYNHNQTLVIDPLIASTFIGGTSTDGGYYTSDDMALDASGNVYVTGATLSSDYPVQAGAYNQTHNGGSDIYISKLNSDLTVLQASTFIGGSSNEEVRDLVIDNFGNIYIAGITTSSDYPTSVGAYDDSYNGGTSNPYGSGDAFISKLDNNLSQLLSSTFVGGSGHDNCSSLGLDNFGNVFISGTTSSTNFPISPGAYDSTHQAGGNFQDDVFISKLDSNLTTLLASTYIGGSHDDFCEDLAIDNNGNIYISGWVRSTNFPTTPGAYDNSYNGHSYDAFISKFNNNLTSLTASTYLGGTSWEFIYGMCLDDSANIYVTGHTASTNFPTSPGAYDNSYNGSAGANFGDDVFVSKLDSSLAIMKASTYLGGSLWENGYSVRVKNDKIYVSGTSSSTDFPTSNSAFSNTYQGGTKYAGDIFISLFDNNLQSLNASTYIGGNSDEEFGSIEIDNTGNVYISGATASSGYPVSGSAYDTTYNGGNSDAFVSILDSLLSNDPTLIKDNEHKQPLEFGLSKNFPNPFNPNTTIEFKIQTSEHVLLSIYNTSGQLVKTLINNRIDGGTHLVRWNGTNNSGESVSSGLYLCTLKTAKFNDTNKMLLIR